MKYTFKTAKINEKLQSKVDEFFTNSFLESKGLEYRPGQDTLAFDIVDALSNKEILLIEAGVGSGKSFGYLVPLIYASQSDPNFKFIISTSSKALQDQLEKGIDFLSNLLNIPIEVTVAKGRNNYLCRRRFEYYAKKEGSTVKEKSIRKKIYEGKVDKKDFDELTQEEWKRINVDKVRCIGCMDYRECSYRLKRKQWPEKKAVICNHNLLVESLRRNKDNQILSTPSILIVDEAHALEEKIRDSYKKSLNKKELESLVYALYWSMNKNVKEDIPVITQINELFKIISYSAKNEYRKTAQEDIEVFDSENSGFKCTKQIVEKAQELIVHLKALADETEFFLNGNSEKRSDENLQQLKEIIATFQDLIIDPSKQKNIYWAAFIPDTKEHIEIQYVPRNVNELARRLLEDPSFAKVFTSATLTTEENDYSYFMKGLGLGDIKGVAITQEFSQPSPYNYDENAILYCPQDLVSPKSKNREEYLTSITDRIEELLDVTEGRSLILFTSKSDMKEVYEKLNKKERDYNIYVQEDGKSGESLKQKFKEDETSCLLATGSFWEGLDIKGDSVESVIITKLPFHVVDPVMQEKASRYTDGFKEVYLKDMILKLKQGTGRLIRSSSDKGIVSILDPRTKDYGEEILNNLPFTNVTASLDDVKEFANEKLKCSEEKSKEYTKQ